MSQAAAREARDARWDEARDAWQDEVAARWSGDEAATERCRVASNWAIECWRAACADVDAADAAAA